MTNAEKYLKDGVDIEEFTKDIFKNAQISTLEFIPVIAEKALREYLRKRVKPTLTEDERVILRNLQNVRYIGRTEGTGYLYATFNTIDNYSNRSDITDIDLYFSKMFPFIKERRRI